MKTKEELLAQRNTPNFHENPDIVKKKKFNLETNDYTTKTALCVSQGTVPEVCLGGVGYRIRLQPGLDLDTQIPQQEDGKSQA